jgi:hypothetical protein
MAEHQWERGDVHIQAKRVEQCNQLRVLAGPKKNAKSSRKKLDTNYSMSKFSWRIKKMPCRLRQSL